MTNPERPLETVLIVPLDGDLVESPEHLGVSMLAAVLRAAGMVCDIVEVAPGGEMAALEEIRARNPGVVGISLTTVNLPLAQDFGRLVRAWSERAHIVLGGPIATAVGGRLLRLPRWEFADSVVRGEADAMIVDFVRALAEGRSPDGLPGVCLRGSVGFETVARVTDLSCLPWPARDQFERRPFGYLRLSTSRGCTSRCTFCDAPNAGNRPHTKPWRGRDSGDVVDEIEFLVRHYGVDTFDFVDSTFEDPGGREIGKRRVRAIAEDLIARGLDIYFNCGVQAQNWTEADAPLIDLLYRAGLEKVLIGIEAGNVRSLGRHRKRAGVDDNERAIALFRRVGVFVAFGFIMFDPYATFEDIEDNARFLRRTVGHNLRRFLTRLELYPGAAIVNKIRSDGLLEDDFDLTFRPYAYRFEDPRVGRLAHDLARLAGPDYARTGRLGLPTPVIEFETFDIRAFTGLARHQRRLGDRPPYAELIAQGRAEIEAVQAALGETAFEFFMTAVERARRGEGIPDQELDRVNARYAEAMREIGTASLKLGMRLRRAEADAA